MLARWGEAIAEFETAIRLDPGNASAHCNLGVVYLEEKNPVAAIGALQECLRLSPNELRARVALARALQALKAQGNPAGR
jgi:cytochrome c-type biogenesis protein CcmH/NrfG